MNKIKSIFFVVIFIFLSLFVFYFVLGPFSRISLVKLNVDEKLKATQSYQKKEEEILFYLNNYKGKFLWQVDLKDLVKKVSVFYSEAEVYATRKIPGHLIVFLKKKDIALLLLKDGEFFYSVSYEGEIGNKRNPEESFDFPVLRGDPFWDNPQLRTRVLSILSSLPKTGPFFSVQNISEISYDEINDSFLFYLSLGRFTLELREQVSPKKMQNIDFVLNYLSQKGNQNSFIDARFNQKIIVKNLD